MPFDPAHGWGIICIKVGVLLAYHHQNTTAATARATVTLNQLVSLEKDLQMLHLKQSCANQNGNLDALKYNNMFQIFNFN